MNTKIALENLVKKIEEIENNDSFKSMFSVSYVHGIRYSGPNWSKELNEAKEVLKQSNKLPINLCTGQTVSNVDLFDIKQLQIRVKSPEESKKELDECGKKMYKVVTGLELDIEPPLKDELEE